AREFRQRSRSRTLTLQLPTLVAGLILVTYVPRPVRALQGEFHQNRPMPSSRRWLARRRAAPGSATGLSERSAVPSGPAERDPIRWRTFTSALTPWRTAFVQRRQLRARHGWRSLALTLPYVRSRQTS